MQQRYAELRPRLLRLVAEQGEDSSGSRALNVICQVASGDIDASELADIATIVDVLAGKPMPRLNPHAATIKELIPDSAFSVLEVYKQWQHDTPPSLAQLEKGSGKSRKTVIRWKRWLIEQGFLDEGPNGAIVVVRTL